MASAAVHSKAVIMLLLIHCLLLLPLGVGGGVCVVVFGVLPCLTIILLRKRELVALLLLCCGYLYSVPLPHGAVGCSADCD